MREREPSVRGFTREVVKEFATLKDMSAVGDISVFTAVILWVDSRPLAGAGVATTYLLLDVLSTIASFRAKKWVREERHIARFRN